MSPWSTFPFLRFTFALIGGILVAHHWEKPTCIVVGSLLGILLLIYVLAMVGIPRPKFFTWSPWLGFWGLGCIFLLGYLRCLSHAVHHDPKHLTQVVDPIEAYEATALEDAHQKGDKRRVVVTVGRARVQGKWQQVQGKVQVSWSLKTALEVLYGDVLLIQGQPCAVRIAGNPHGFDYAAFLGFSKIYHQHSVVAGGVVKVAQRPPNPVKALSFRVLRYCSSLLAQRLYHPEVRAVVLALVLGQKHALTSKVSTSYARAGAMHVLAVSGLHVGIIYWILCVLLLPLRYVGRLRFLSSGTAVLVLWFYAFVTGLSPSVLRATAMFTFMAIAPVLSRQTSSYNTLFASAFLLLLWDPMLLFSVGFQLSYLAVLGILYLQPRIYGILFLNNWLLNKLWLLTSVSLSAQLGTTPLGVYYFHQFPTYFLVANWVVVPAAFAIVCLGLLVLATGFWPGFSMAIAWLLERVVLGVNAWIEGTQKLPYSLIESIYLSTSGAFLLYVLLVLLLAFLHTKRMQYLIAMSILAMFLSLRAAQVYLDQQTQCKVIFYNVGRHQVISFVKGKHSTLCVDSRFQIDSPKYAYHVQPSQMALGITSADTHILAKDTQQQKFPMQLWHGMKVVVWQGKKFILIDKESKNLPRLAQKIYTDFLVIEENAVTTLQPLLDRFDFGTLVIGASNQRFLAHQLQAEASNSHIDSHSLLQDGALTVSW